MASSTTAQGLTAPRRTAQGSTASRSSAARGQSAARARARVEPSSWNTARRHRIGAALVWAQLVLVVQCLLPLGPVLGPAGSPVASAIGAVCLGAAALVGGLALHAMGRDLRANPVPAASATLRTRGIYAVIRHPMYAAVMLACLGVTLLGGRLLALLSVAALGAVLWVKARFEDRMLFDQFGWQFAMYASHVPAVVPAPWRSHRR